MTIDEAVRQSISRIRKPHWAWPSDVLVLNVAFSEQHGRNLYGPWATLHSPTMKELPGMEHLEEQQVFVLGDSADDWEAA